MPKKHGDLAVRELEAMRISLEAIRGLPHESVKRVLDWLSVQGSEGAAVAKRATPSSASGNPAEPPDRDFSIKLDLAEFFASAEPATGPEKVLLVAYWIQENESPEGFLTLEVTRHLKELGHPIANTAATLGLLQSGSPRFVQQAKKSGTTRQARKLYRVTEAGRARVREMLSRGSDT